MEHMTQTAQNVQQVTQTAQLTQLKTTETLNLLDSLELTILEKSFSVCKIKDTSDVNFMHPFVFLSKTDEEISLVCESEHVPSNVIVAEPDWRAFRIAGTLDFSLVGVVASITSVLAKASISVFVISTYNTDYVFLKSYDFERAVSLIRNV